MRTNMDDAEAARRLLLGAYSFDHARPPEVRYVHEVIGM
jgi:hypothetical protein